VTEKDEAREKFERMIYSIREFALSQNMDAPKLLMNRYHRRFVLDQYSDRPVPTDINKMTFAGVEIRFGEIRLGEIFECL